MIVFMSYFIATYHETILTNVPEKILDTIVYVNVSTGVIIYSDSEYSLVLTAYHTVSESVNKDGTFKKDTDPPSINFEYNFETENETKRLNIHYKVASVEVYKKYDLALLRVDIGSELNYSRLKVDDSVRVGDEVYIAANPNHNYKSITKGIVSSTERYVRGTHVWQISGGVIFGSSGGGAFTTDGELIGVIAAVDMYGTGFCIDQVNDKITIEQCLRSSIPYIGYFVSLPDIKDFLFSTEFKDKFNYLK